MTTPLWGRIRKYYPLYLMLLPGIVYYVIYRYFPLYGLTIAFKDYSMMDGIMGSGWADPWYKYFREFYLSPYFYQLIGNTLLLSVYKIVWATLPQIALAVLLFECRSLWFRGAIQTLSYMPHFLSWVIINGLAVAFLSSNNGLVNKVLESAGFSSIPFLTSNDWFRGVLVSTDVWKDLGWGAIIYLAAMSAINPTLFEAAKVDGASRMRMIWHITLPGIRSVIVLLLILKLGHLLDAGFEQVYIMYNISVYPTADIIDTWVFRTGLEQLNFSLAAAVGFFKSAVGLVLVIGANRLAKRWGENVW
ncbi:ABC transporter permease [Paenibacillaceae bacterium WGS1546]|uniref:ABC transporter permease n=1 Tax=Cohnella sp. WGS1546 TaxID=3366810 RepID=UPI00372D53E0